ncbi:hypothetical protein M8C21_012301 [Ambrosia artemisiifolia]|uniref:NPH3 domain-containing protein n=1 Tax=Ambrosia artemisiifolia TaxID=4212 RepID=A0AAD5CU74_AMBAR|nr:hypothetical protein M8C21_012301 [Ambrosia artemisiifolia]
MRLPTVVLDGGARQRHGGGSTGWCAMYEITTGMQELCLDIVQDYEFDDCKVYMDCSRCFVPRGCDDEFLLFNVSEVIRVLAGQPGCSCERLSSKLTLCFHIATRVIGVASGRLGIEGGEGQKMQELQRSLPAYKQKEALLDAISNNQAHPAISSMDRKKVCSLMDCQKLSNEARSHASQNERLPVQTMVQVLYYEQQRLRETTGSPINNESSHPLKSQNISSLSIHRH